MLASRGRVDACVVDADTLPAQRNARFGGELASAALRVERARPRRRGLRHAVRPDIGHANSRRRTTRAIRADGGGVFAAVAAEAAPPQRFRPHVCYTDGGMVSALPGLQIDALLAYRLCQRAGGVVRPSGGARGGLAAAGGGRQWDSCRGCWCRVRCAGQRIRCGR